jgi:hypothetical protein
MCSGEQLDEDAVDVDKPFRSRTSASNSSAMCPQAARASLRGSTSSQSFSYPHVLAMRILAYDDDHEAEGCIVLGSATRRLPPTVLRRCCVPVDDGRCHRLSRRIHGHAVMPLRQNGGR